MAVAGTQRVITRGGPVPVKRLVGKRGVEIWDGDSFALVDVERLEHPVRFLDVALSNRTSVRCTEDHVFYAPATSQNGYRKPVSAGASSSRATASR